MGKHNFTQFNSSMLERNKIIALDVTRQFCRVANREAFDKYAGKLNKLRANNNLFLPKIIELTDKHKEPI